MANKKKADPSGLIMGRMQYGLDQSQLFKEELSSPAEDQEEPKAAAPKAEQKKKTKLEDLYSLHTYWIRKDLITKIRDYAYTERRSVRQAINKIIDIAFDQIEKEYQAKGKNLEHYEGDEEL